MKTGIFQDSDEVYHAEQHVGSTSLKQMTLSPAHFLRAWQGPKQDSTKAFDEGRATHAVLLEQNLDPYVKRPDGVDGRTKEGKAILAELAATGKTVLDGEVYDSMIERLESFTKHETAMSLYKDARVEQSHYIKDAETGLHLKCRPDIAKGGVLSDLKTTARIETFETQIWSLKYHIQVGLYCLVYEQSTGTKVREFNFIAMEKSAPFGIKVFRFDRAMIEYSQGKARELINRASVCINENVFNSYDDIAVAVTRIPPWIDNDNFAFEQVG